MIENVIKILKNTSPSLGLGSVPLNGNGLIGWKVFRLKGGKPNETLILADGTYAGFAGKDKLFVITNDKIDEVEKFYYLKDFKKKEITLTIGKRKPVNYKLESIGFVDYNW